MPIQKVDSEPQSSVSMLIVMEVVKRGGLYQYN